MYGLPTCPPEIQMRARYTMSRLELDRDVMRGEADAYRRANRHVVESLRAEVSSKIIDECIEVTEFNDHVVWDLNVIVASEKQFWNLVNQRATEVARSLSVPDAYHF